MTSSTESVRDFELAWEPHLDGPCIRWRVGETTERTRADLRVVRKEGYMVLWLRGINDMMADGRGVIPLSISTDQPSFYLLAFLSKHDIVECNHVIGDISWLVSKRITSREICRENEDGVPVSVFAASRAGVEKFHHALLKQVRKFDFGDH
jgi:hypothetical protein